MSPLCRQPEACQGESLGVPAPKTPPSLRPLRLLAKPAGSPLPSLTLSRDAGGRRKTAIWLGPSPSVACREPLGEPYTRRTETDRPAQATNRTDLGSIIRTASPLFWFKRGALPLGSKNGQLMRHRGSATDPPGLLRPRHDLAKAANFITPLDYATPGGLCRSRYPLPENSMPCKRKHHHFLELAKADRS